MSTANDYTPTGVKIEGSYENDRNAENSELYKAIIREVFGVTDVIIAHHLVYVTKERRDGFEYQIIEEIPSADALTFDHEVAKVLWPQDWQDKLTQLALQPCETRDKLLAKFYYEGRNA